MPFGPTAAITMRIDELAQRVSAESDARGVYEALHAYVAATTPMNGFFVARHDEATKLRTCVYAFSDGVEVDATTLPPLPLNGSPNSRAIETRKPVLVEDYARATAGRPVHYIAVEVNPTLPTSALAVPMLARDRVIGLLTIQSPSRQAFGAHEVEVLQSAANLAALALENLALRQGLEQLVDARTTALAEANHELRRHAVARDLVRHMLGRLSQQVDARPTTLREIGRDVAASLGADSIAAYAAAYAQRSSPRATSHWASSRARWDTWKRAPPWGRRSRASRAATKRAGSWWAAASTADAATSARRRSPAGGSSTLDTSTRR